MHEQNVLGRTKFFKINFNTIIENSIGQRRGFRFCGTFGRHFGMLFYLLENWEDRKEKTESDSDEAADPRKAGYRRHTEGVATSQVVLLGLITVAVSTARMSTCVINTMLEVVERARNIQEFY